MRFLLLCLLFAVSFSLQAQSIVYVTESGRGDESGTSWDNALPGTSLANRVSTASSGTQFWIAAGTYKPTTTADRTASFSIASGISLYGGFSGNETKLAKRNTGLPLLTVLSGGIGTSDYGDNSFHVVRLHDASSSTRLDALAITNGFANADQSRERIGAGVYCSVSTGKSCSPVFVNCVIEHNTAATDGGGIYNDGVSGNCTPTFTKCRIKGNHASQGSGGGMYNNGATGNSSPALINCMLTGNVAIQGSAIYNEAYQGNCTTNITNCIFKGNLSQAQGGVVYNRGVLGTCHPLIANTIFWENPYSRPSIYNEAATAFVRYSDIEDGYPGTGNIRQDPKFFNFYTNDFRLLKNSPAINTGDPSLSPLSGDTTDVEGKPRVLNGRIDMGVVEYQPNAVTGIIRVSPSTSTGMGTSWDNPLDGSTLSAALSEAAPSTQFWLKKGVYFPTFTVGDRASSFVVPSGVKLYGGFAGTETTLGNRQLTYPSSTSLSGDVGIRDNITDNSYHLITLENVSAETHLDNLVITDGNATDEPITGASVKGAIININSYARFTNCLITKNNTRTPLGIGGGMTNYRSSPTIINCTFNENFSYLGGGMFNADNSQPIITNCLFTNNSAVQGGVGSAIYSTNDSRVFLTNCTIARNTDAYSFGPLVSTANTINCIICESFNSQTPDVPNPSASQNCTLWADSRGSQALTNDLFVNTAGSNFRLRPGSPAINAGYPVTGLPPLDLGGLPRLLGGQVDIGAYEFNCGLDICTPFMVRRSR